LLHHMLGRHHRSLLPARQRRDLVPDHVEATVRLPPPPGGRCREGRRTFA
jgi:hypothetical protein